MVKGSQAALKLIGMHLLAKTMNVMSKVVVVKTIRQIKLLVLMAV